MIKNSRSTIYLLYLLNRMLFKEKYTALPGTTLNEKLGVCSEIRTCANESDYPTPKYFAIGVGGEDVISNGSTYSFSKHTVVDAAPFDMVPFIMVPIDEDIPEDKQMGYRLKKIEIVNNRQYYCYYLKVFSNNPDTRDIFFKLTPTVVDGIISNIMSIFDTGTASALNPVPNDIDVTKCDIMDIHTIAYFTKVPFILTVNELKYLSDAISIKYPKKNKRFTDVSICGGEDIILPNGRVEAAVVQVYTHFTMDMLTSLENANNTQDFIRYMDMGGLEPYPLLSNE